MSQGNYIKTFAGYCGLPMMVAHAPELGGDLPCIFAAMPHPHSFEEVSSSVLRLQRAQMGDAFNRMSRPTAVLVVPEDLEIRPAARFLMLAKAGNTGGEHLVTRFVLQRRAQTLQRTLGNNLHEGVDRAARHYMQAQLEGCNPLSFV